jgi:hypothetical protein
MIMITIEYAVLSLMEFSVVYCMFTAYFRTRPRHQIDQFANMVDSSHSLPPTI